MLPAGHGTCGEQDIVTVLEESLVWQMEWTQKQTEFTQCEQCPERRQARQGTLRSTQHPGVSWNRWYWR